jgi:hypothetical protein
MIKPCDADRVKHQKTKTGNKRPEHAVLPVIRSASRIIFYCAADDLEPPPTFRRWSVSSIRK